MCDILFRSDLKVSNDSVWFTYQKSSTQIEREQQQQQQQQKGEMISKIPLCLANVGGQKSF